MVEASRRTVATPERLARQRSTLAGLLPTAEDVVPIGPNFIATAATFVFLLVAPTLCLWLFEEIWKDDVADDPIAAYLLRVDLPRTALQAASGAGAFLLIATILQVWRHHRPLPAYRPVLFALLIAWVWVIPEAIARGGSVVSGAVIGSALAVAFAIQWGLTVHLVRVLD